MTYVLVVISLFTATNAVATQTRFQEFDTQAACEAARAGIDAWLGSLKGATGRWVFAACYPKGSGPAR